MGGTTPSEALAAWKPNEEGGREWIVKTWVCVPRVTDAMEMKMLLWDDPIMVIGRGFDRRCKERERWNAVREIEIETAAIRGHLRQ